MCWKGFIMHRTWLLPVFLLFCQAALPAQPPRRDRDNVPAVEDANDTFARQLYECVQLISNRYVRPVPRSKLAMAAFRRIYEAAGVTVPSNLAGNVDRALRSDDFVKLAASIRENLGDRPALRGGADVRLGLQAMVETLDQYCGIQTGPERRTPRQLIDRTAGFGLIVADGAQASGVRVKSVVLGSPAQQAGLRPGDLITEVDGERLGQGGPGIVRKALAGQDPIRLNARTSQNVDRMITIKPAEYEQERILGVCRRRDNSWDYFIDSKNKIAHLRIASLESHAFEQLVHVLMELEETGIRGMILDLRWCPGGYLSEARGSAELFLGDYGIAYFMMPTPCNLVARFDPFLDDHRRNATVRYRESTPDTREARPPRTFAGFPVVVLINRETIGGAEMMAAVLQDNKRAIVLGQRTKGKANVQNFFPLDSDLNEPSLGREWRWVPIPEVTLKMTTGMLIRPNGKNMHRFPDSAPGDDWGVLPDPNHELRLSPELDHRLQSWYERQDYRSCNDNALSPLDNPHADPLRERALRLLRRILVRPDSVSSPIS
jgi:C-terminal processing protease CtpA/Prc